MQQNDPLALTWDRVAQLRLRAASAGGPWLMTALLFLVALALRLDLDSSASGEPFAAFHVALMVTALACGWRCAASSAAAAAVAEWFFFLRAPAPANEGGGAMASAVALASFALVAAAEIALADMLARAAGSFCSRAKAAEDTDRSAARRLALVAARFVAEPAVATSETVSARLALVERLSDGAVGPWGERMEAIRPTREPQPRETRIVGDGDGLRPDRLLAISLAVQEMLREASEAGCGMFEATLTRDVAAGRTLEVRSGGGRLSRIDQNGAPPWPDMTNWLARTLDARVIVSTESDPGVRFHFDG